MELDTFLFSSSSDPFSVSLVLIGEIVRALRDVKSCWFHCPASFAVLSMVKRVLGRSLCSPVGKLQFYQLKYKTYRFHGSDSKKTVCFSFHIKLLSPARFISEAKENILLILRQKCLRNARFILVVRSWIILHRRPKMTQLWRHSRVFLFGYLSVLSRDNFSSQKKHN